MYAEKNKKRKTQTSKSETIPYWGRGWSRPSAGKPAGALLQAGAKVNRAPRFEKKQFI